MVTMMCDAVQCCNSAGGGAVLMLREGKGEGTSTWGERCCRDHPRWRCAGEVSKALCAVETGMRGVSYGCGVGSGHLALTAAGTLRL